jgi:hypothetical protein
MNDIASLYKAMASTIPSFSQPILPGWTFNIDSNNSSSPSTEAQVVSKFSYGRQLGQISDALATIVATLPPSLQADKKVKRFTDMKDEIDRLKTDNLDERVDALAAALRSLKHSNPDEFERISAPLRNLLRR